MKLDEALAILRSNFPSLQQKFGVATISIFGSVARNEAGPESDIDILVEYLPGKEGGYFSFAQLQRELEQMLNCRVDLATLAALRRELKDDILREAIRAA